MSIEQIMKTTIKRILYATPIARDYAHGAILYRRFGRSGKGQGGGSSLLGYGSRLYQESLRSSKAWQIAALMNKVDIRPAENRLNGNVIDFITSPGMLQQNREKYAALLRTGFVGGIFQLQMNVVDSKTLIAAKADPTLFPNLVVRVWGFSAFFNDLPEEYKDVLIKRALESEKAA